MSAQSFLPRAARAALALVAFASLPAAAQTGQLVPTSIGRPEATVLSLREMSIDVGLARGYARVNVRQVFENHTGSIQEGTWRFRLPDSGAVGDFAVWDGEVRIPGVILEKRRARSIYRELTTQRIDPGLLQQGEEEDRPPDASGRAAERPSGGAVFSVKVAPIPAWGTKRLEMQFQHEIPWVDGVAELRLPLRASDGEPMRAGSLDVTVTVLDGTFEAPVAGALELVRSGKRATFGGRDVKLDRDLVVRYRRPAGSNPLALSTYRNPAGTLPDGLALAPWERPSELPPEKDGFFLLELERPVGLAKEEKGAGKGAEQNAARGAAAEKRTPLTLVFLFDTSLSHRFAGLESAYRTLVRLLDALRPEDRFVLVPFDLAPAPDPAGVAPATAAARGAALEYLRSRPLSPGTDVAAAVAAARALAGAAGSAGRIVLLTDGVGAPGDLVRARAGVPLFTVLTGDERREGFAVASEAVLSVSTASDGDSADERLFARRLFAAGTPAATPARKEVASRDLPFTVKGGDPKLRDVYSVMTQPPAPGALAGWIGRYGAPSASTTVTLRHESEVYEIKAPFPETDLSARDLPRRWARARVDDLLRRIELEGEKREWVDEILSLSRRYKFVTPYTAFLAAPRSLLRPRRIQPGDPVIRIEADPGIVAAAALLPFGTRVELTRRAGTSSWQGRFLVPEGLADGRMAVRLVLRDSSGAMLVETKQIVVDGTPPAIRPEVKGAARAGQPYRVTARTDSDVLFLSVRLGSGPPIPLRWDPSARLSAAELVVPDGTPRESELFFEATDGAGNHGFARARLEVR